jgi:hypothetical protein
MCRQVGSSVGSRNYSLFYVAGGSIIDDHIRKAGRDDVNTSVAPRVQLTLARLNIEEQPIAQLAAQLDRARMELAQVGLESRKLSDLLADVEKELQT